MMNFNLLGKEEPIKKEIWDITQNGNLTSERYKEEMNSIFKIKDSESDQLALFGSKKTFSLFNGAIIGKTRNEQFQELEEENKTLKLQLCSVALKNHNSEYESYISSKRTKIIRKRILIFAAIIGVGLIIKNITLFL